MKKLTTALLTALLLLNLAACGEKEPDDTPSGYDDSLISELYSEEGEYTDAENNTLAYSYHVPRIVSETAVAAALNDEGVRLVEYSPETRDYFDLFPGTQPDLTIRPAVMQGERVLARGQATEEL